MNVILMYHRIADLAHDPYGLAVHPDRFAAHVEHLRILGSTVPLENVVEPGTSGRIALTFDDGYADNATVAAPMLADTGLPVTWFITAGRLGARRFWWDRLGEALLGPHQLPSSVDAEVAGRALWLDLRTPTARDTALRFLHRRLRPLPPDALEASVDQLVASLGAPEPAPNGLTMTVEQLRATADLPLSQVGAHTRTHLQLRDQDEQLQREEVLGSVADLAALLERPVTTFAYPFGSRSAVGALAPRLVEEAGCRLACSTETGPVLPSSERHLLPRLNVGDWSRAEFTSRLESVLLGD